MDILSIAAPNFWHAPATILACEAGKHVYVEKPGSYDPQEGEWMVAAARKYDRRVQQGTQRLSYASMIDGMAKLHNGVIGTVKYARTWYHNTRDTIGTGNRTGVRSDETMKFERKGHRNTSYLTYFTASKRFNLWRLSSEIQDAAPGNHHF